MNNKDNELRARKDFGVTESKKREYPPLPEKLTTTTVDAHCHLDIEDEDIFMSVEDSLAKAKAVGKIFDDVYVFAFYRIPIF